MIETSKMLTFTGASVIETTDIETGVTIKVPVATIHYSVADSGEFSENVHVSNPELYAQHKDTVRADIDAFRAACRTEEDSFK